VSECSPARARPPRPPAAGGPDPSVVRLGPDDAFPADLTELGLVALQVLHSRICRQLDHDHLTDPDGPHPITLDRHQQLVVELRAREISPALTHAED